MTSLRLSLDRPSTATLQHYVQSARVSQRSLNHGFSPGGNAPEDQLREMAFSADLGVGRDCYDAACRLLLDWQMHRGSSVTGIYWTCDDDAVVTWAKMAPALWVLNPCRSVAPAANMAMGSRADAVRSVAVAYATAQGHLLAGVEHMRVTQSVDGTVCFHVHSASRGAGLIGRALFPLLAPAQRRFFREQCRCMHEAVKGVVGA
jgi:uncharacterized protein (UPF0548 family)